MSIDRSDKDDSAQARARRLLVRAAAAPDLARGRLAASIDDFFLPDDARLGERLRAVLATTLAAMVEVAERDIRQHIAGTGLAAGVVLGEPVFDRLMRSGLMRDKELLGEVIGRIRQDLLADMLPVAAPDELAMPGLLARLAGSSDRAVASAAVAFMAADSRRRDSIDTNRFSQTELPAELHYRLVWWVAAAIREQLDDRDGESAIADAAIRSLASHDEGDRIEGAATRLAAAIDAQPAELPTLLTHALGERQVPLFVALIARALGTDYTAARELVIDSARDRLWLALRAVGLDRTPIARIGLSLSEADPGADIDSFADQLDDVVAVTPADARAALASLQLHPDYRAAIAALRETR